MTLRIQTLQRTASNTRHILKNQIYIDCCCCSSTQSCWTLCEPMNCSTPDFPVPHHLLSLLKIMSIESVIHPASVLCCPLLLPLIFPSIRVFLSELFLRIRWPEYWSFSLSIRPSNEQSELISFRMDWFDLLAVQETLKSLLQHHSSKASVLQHSTFFIVQLLHPYMTTGRNHSSDKMDFSWQCLCFLICLSRLVIDFLPRSKYLLISWLHSPSAVILEPKKWPAYRFFRSR